MLVWTGGYESLKVGRDANIQSVRRARTTVRGRVRLEDLDKLDYEGLSKLAGEFENQYRGGPETSLDMDWMCCLGDDFWISRSLWRDLTLHKQSFSGCRHTV